MIETVVAYQLAVGETLRIQKKRLMPGAGNPNIGRISIVSGIHGDELEGQYVCYEIIRRIQEHPENLNGIVDVYPALNPLGVDSGSRVIPKLNMDMNRMFPGEATGTMMDKLAARIIEDIKGSDICVDVHASDTFVKEMPQVRISEEHGKDLVDFSRLLNADLIWINASATAHEATLTNSLNTIGVPALLVEMGLGNRVTRSFGDQITEGIFNLMHEIGIWSGPVGEIRNAKLTRDYGIDFFRAQSTGIFLPDMENGQQVSAGDMIGKIVSTLSGDVLEIVQAKRSGILFTLREYPLVYEGSLIARVLAEERNGW